jgi:hypothetical protein
MIDMRRKKWVKRLYKETIAIFLTTFLLCTFVGFIIVQNKIETERLQIEQLILESCYRINEVVSKQLYKTQALAALVIKGDGTVNNFQGIAAFITEDNPALANVLLAPDGVVTDVYPNDSIHAAVIGLDFFNEVDHPGNKEAIMARDTDELLMAGPFMLRQGIIGLVGRYPVYINTETEGRKFWGLVSVSLKFPEALDGAGLSLLEYQGLSYELWRINPDTLEKQIIASNREHSGSGGAYVERAVNILNAEWFFRIYPAYPWYKYPETWISVIAGILVSLLVATTIQNYQGLKRLRHLHSQSVLKKHMTTMKLLVSSMEKQNLAAQQHRKASALLRHDMRHIGGMLLLCIEKGDVENAHKLINEIDASIQKIENIDQMRKVTGHNLIDAAIAFYTQACNEENITINVHMQHVDGVSVDLTELAVSLSNALENAVNACRKIPKGENRVINMIGSWRGKQYFIELTNTCAEEVIFDSDTGYPVSYLDGHGFGSQSIAYFTQKHNAGLQYKYENGWFSMRLLI